MNNTRRKFLKNVGTGLLAFGVSSPFLNEKVLGLKINAHSEDKDLFKVGIAGYTFRKFDLDASLKMVARVNVHYLCIKNFHLPFDSTAEQISEFHKKLKAMEIIGYAVGPITMDSEAAVDEAFDYARRVGVQLITGNSKILPYVEKKIKEYDFRFGIHSYSNLDDVYARIKDLDPRIGFCHDVGYTRLSGLDPAEYTLKYSNRIYDLHIKDVTLPSKEGKDCELGRGVIDFASLIAALRKTIYNGVCSLEFEKDPEDPLPGVAESIGYFNGVKNTV